MRSESPTRAQLTSSSRHARLVSRFSDLYAIERLETQSLLRRYIDDLETVQRIIFIAAVVQLLYSGIMSILCFCLIMYIFFFPFNSKNLSSISIVVTVIV